MPHGEFLQPISARTGDTYVAPPLLIHEHANRTSPDQALVLTYNASTGEVQNASAYVPLPAAWTGNQIDLDLSNIYENRCWIKDIGFESTGNWTTHNIDFTNFPHPAWINRVESGAGTSGSNGVHIKLDSWDGGASQSRYFSTAQAFLEQNITFERESVDAVGLRFDYKVNTSWDLDNMGAFRIFMSIDQLSSQTRTQKTYTYYNYTDSGLPSLNFLKAHDIVIWSTLYETTNTLNAGDRDLLRSYLNDEGKLFLTGRDIADDLQNPPESEWLANYLHASYNGSHTTNEPINGSTGGIYDGLSLVSLSSGANPDWLEDPAPNATVCMEYNVSQVDQRPAAINWSSSMDNNATIFFGFGLEYVSNFYERSEILNRTLNYLNDSYKSVLFVDDTNASYGSIITQSLEEIGLEDVWKRVYQKSFLDIESLNQWFDSGLISISADNVPNNGTHVNLGVRIGLKHSSNLLYSPEPNPEIWVDNVELYTVSKVKPSVLNLTMNNLSISDVGENAGSITQLAPLEYNQVQEQIDANFSFIPTISTTDPLLPIEISFKTDMNLHANRTGASLYELDPAKTGVNYEVTNNASQWTFFYYVGIPTDYGDHFFNLSIPYDWNVTFVAEPIYPLINIVDQVSGGNYTGQLLVPTTNITAFHDGYWSIRANSTNYVQEIVPQLFDGITWQNTTKFFVTNKTRVLARIGSSSQVLNASCANLTITAPGQAIWWSGQATSIVGNWVVFPNLTIGSLNTTGGAYEVKVHWSNGTEAGRNVSQFMIIHNSEMILREPQDARGDSVAEMKYGDLLLLRVRANDTDSDQLVPGIIVQVNWTGGQLNLTDKGTGEYEITLDTSELVFIPDKNYTLKINSSSPYYANSTIFLTIIFNFDTILTHDPITSVPFGGNATVYLNYKTLVGDPIPNATVYANATLSNPTTFNDSGTDKYKLTINTTGLSSTDLINITVKRLRFETKTIFLPLPIREVFTELLVSPGNITIIDLPYEEQYSELFLRFNDTEFNMGIDGASLTFLGYSLVNYTSLGNGLYRINFTANNQTESYNVLIIANKTNYLSSSVQIILRIFPWSNFIDSTIYGNPVQVGLPGETVYFMFDFYDSFNNSYLSAGVQTSYSWRGGSGQLQYASGNFSLALNTAGVSSGQHNVLISISNQNGTVLTQLTVTVVVTTPPMNPLWLILFLFLGIGGTLAGIPVYYFARRKVRERHWERKIKHIYLFHSRTGAAIFDRRVGGMKTADSSLITSALLGIGAIMKEIMISKKQLKTIDHMDNKILFAPGKFITGAIMASEDLGIIRKKLEYYVNEFEYTYGEDLLHWDGNIGRFKLANKMLGTIFPLAESIPESKEITARWAIDNLNDIYGADGIRVLEMLDKKITNLDDLTANLDFDRGRIENILRTLHTFRLIDNANQLQAQGREALKLYQEDKEYNRKNKKNHRRKPE